MFETRAAHLEGTSAEKRAKGDTKGADADQKTAEGLRESARDLKGKAYDPVRKNFWEEVYKDKNMRAQIEAAGLKFEEGKAPYLEVPDPKNPGQVIKMDVTLEHAERKTDVPSRAQDPDNLLFTFRHENTDLLERIREIMRWRTENPKGPQPQWKDSESKPKPKT